MTNLGRYLIPVAAVACLIPQVTSGMALILGVALAVVFSNPYLAMTRKYTSQLLQTAVVGLGAGMNLIVVGRVGLHGIGYTVLGISLTMLIGYILARALRTPRDTSILIMVGTAICGGSAIAAMAPTIRAKPHDVSVSLAVVFMLNALALILFPWIGHILGLTENQFGLWGALAIHDTSSVVGATLQYGPKALEIGTTVKLARALWIVPLTLIVGYVVNRRAQTVSEVKAKYPWFILGFILMAALVTWIPALHEAGHWIEFIAKRLLVVTLFLIGASITREALRTVGVRPLLLGVLLWASMASLSLLAIDLSWISI